MYVLKFFKPLLIWHGSDEVLFYDDKQNQTASNAQ